MVGGWWLVVDEQAGGWCEKGRKIEGTELISRCCMWLTLCYNPTLQIRRSFTYTPAPLLPHPDSSSIYSRVV